MPGGRFPGTVVTERRPATVLRLLSDVRNRDGRCFSATHIASHRSFVFKTAWFGSRHDQYWSWLRGLSGTPDYCHIGSHARNVAGYPICFVVVGDSACVDSGARLESIRERTCGAQGPEGNGCAFAGASWSSEAVLDAR